MKIIAVDIGTSRIKVACFDEYGNMSCLHSRRLDRAANPTTQDAREWYSVTAELLREVTKKIKTPDAVSVTGNMHALLGVDAVGMPVSPALLWSDNSAKTESDTLNDICGKELLKICGNLSSPVFTLPKIMQMKHKTPELYARSTSFMQSKDFISFSLTGVRCTDPVDASGVLGMDIATNSWSDDFFSECGIDIAKLPQILPSASICGKVSHNASEFTGLPAGTPVVTGTGDLSSAAVGSGVDKDTVSLTLGTAGQLLATGKRGDGRLLSGKLFVFAHAAPEQELFLGSVPSGGFSFEWLAKMHNITVSEFFELASQSELTGTLPIFMPYILGKGAPSMDYTPAGAWHKLSASHSLADLCRGAVFGALSPLRQCADLLESLTGKRKNIILQALACREKAVRETACELFVQNKRLPENSEASLLGAAIIGAVALKKYDSISSASQKMIKYVDIPALPTQDAQELFEEFLSFASR